MPATTFKHTDIYEGGKLIRDTEFVFNDPSLSVSIDNNKTYTVLPGLVDVHVHLREPGFSYKETISTGTQAAAAGGFTHVCAMPNLNPAPDTINNLQLELDLIKKDACIEVLPYGTITKGENGKELSDMEAMAPFVCAFSDDGRGVQNDDIMRAAMFKAKSLGKLIVAHCEDNSLLNGGYIHDGEYAKAHGHRGISSASEWKQIERDIALVRETGCGYHVCHVSTKESVELIRQAKREGLDITCETAPHYLLMDDSFLREDGNFKMNPPLRSKSDREAMIEGLLDGTIDMIVTDHAPHSAEEKSRGLEKSPMGIIGLETSFPLLYTYLVKPGIISLEKLVELMHDAPCRRFGIKTDIKTDFVVFDLNAEYEIDPSNFKTMGRNTPFTGWKVCGKTAAVIYDSKLRFCQANN